MSVSSESLNFPGQAVLGTVSSFLVNPFVHPVSTVKTRMMDDFKLPLRQACKSQGIYKGFTEMSIADSVVFALAYYVDDKLEEWGYSKFSASILAGMATVPFVSIGEGVTANLQVNSESYSEIVKRAFRRSGFLATVAREVPFNVGLFYLAPLLKKPMEQQLPALLADGVAGTIAGAFVGYVTTPIDLIRARLQTQKESLTIREAVKTAISERGWKGLWRGSVSRSLQVGLATAGLNIAKQTIPAYLPKGMHKDE